MPTNLETLLGQFQALRIGLESNWRKLHAPDQPVTELRTSQRNYKNSRLLLKAALDARFQPNAEWSGVGDEVASLDGATPILLLPARVQTRWVKPTPAGDWELWIRVYPDELMASSHSPMLSTDTGAEDGTLNPGEHSLGQQFWRDRATDEAAAWRSLVRKVGAPRAAWIVRCFVESGGDASRVLRGNVPEAARAHCLPDRWIATGYILLREHIQAFQVASSPVLSPLNLSPDPVLFPPIEGAPDDLTDAGMKWLVDFAEAERVGMGLRVRKSDCAKPGKPDFWSMIVGTGAVEPMGIALLLVVGVRATSSPASVRSELAALLERHHYSDGLALVPQGTATNVTEAGTSGYEDGKVEGDFLWERGLADVAATLENSRALGEAGESTRDKGRWHSAGADLLAGLGLLPSFPTRVPTDSLETFARRHLLGALSNLSLTPNVAPPATARAVRATFFPGLLRRPLADLGVSTDTISRVWRHFASHVSPDGRWSAFRRGAVPYGVQAVTARKNWKDETTDEFAVELNRVLSELYAAWKDRSTQLMGVGASADDSDQLPMILSRDGLSRTLAANNEDYQLVFDELDRVIVKDLFEGRSRGQSTADVVERKYEAWCSQDSLGRISHTWPISIQKNIEIDFLPSMLRRFRVTVRIEVTGNVSAHVISTPHPSFNGDFTDLGRLNDLILNVESTAATPTAKKLAKKVATDILTPSLNGSPSGFPLLWQKAIARDSSEFWEAWAAVRRDSGGPGETIGAEEGWRRAWLQFDWGRCTKLLTEDLESSLDLSEQTKPAVALLKRLYLTATRRDDWWSKGSLRIMQVDRAEDAFGQRTLITGDTDNESLRKLIQDLKRVPGRVLSVSGPSDEFLAPNTVTGLVTDYPLFTSTTRQSWFTLGLAQSLRDLCFLTRMHISAAPGAPASIFGAVPVPLFPVTDEGRGDYEFWNTAASTVQQSAISTEQRERLFLQTFDACQHRLDAWMTSLASQRLESLDQKKVAAYSTPSESPPPNRHLGAWALVHDVPGPPRSAPVQVVHDVPGPPTSVRAQENKGGFIHAPSLDAAMAAAVLRNPVLDPDAGASQFYIDLDASRARGAQELLRGVAVGLDLRTQLGQRIERRLADAELQHWIGPLRRAFPIRGDNRESGDGADDRGRLVGEDRSPVVDGLAVAEHLRVRALLHESEVQLLNAANSRWLVAEQSGQLNINRTTPQSRETFTLLRTGGQGELIRGNSAVRIRTFHDRYLGTDSAGGLRADAEFDKAAVWTVCFVDAPTSTFALQFGLDLAFRLGSGATAKWLARAGDAASLVSGGAPPPEATFLTVRRSDPTRRDDKLLSSTELRRVAEERGWDEYSKALSHLLGAVSDLDATADLMMAESVYQSVQGNSARAGAALAAMDGDGVPPEPHILRSPRSGVPLGFRVALSLGATGSATAWSASASPRSLAEPCLNRWLAERLGDASSYRFLATTAADATPGSTEMSASATLADVPIQPLDLLALAHLVRHAGSPTPLLRGLAQACGWSRVEDSEGHLEALADRLLPLLDVLACRPLQPSDLEPLGVTVSVAGEVLQGRAEAVMRAWEVLIGKASLSGADALRWGLKGETAEAWRAQRDTRETAVEQLAALISGHEAGSEPVTPTDWSDAIRAAVGPDAIVIPPLELSNALPVAPRVKSTELQGWCSQAARTHESLERWWLWRLGEDDALPKVYQRQPTDAEIQGLLRDPEVASFDARLSDPGNAAQATRDFIAKLRGHWIGSALPAALTNDLGLRRAALRALAASQCLLVDGVAVQGNTLVALFVDGWTEQIPLDTVVTGVAFHYDDAGAEAPQVVLVAVPPDQDQDRWSLDVLNQVLLDTFELMKVRGVGLEELADLGQLVSAVTMDHERAKLLSREAP